MTKRTQLLDTGWTRGDHSELLADVKLRQLNPERPQRWVWDPRPDRLNAGRHSKQRVGIGVDCPFLMDALPILEAHAFWEEAVPAENRSLWRQAWLVLSRKPKPVTKVPGKWRLLVLDEGGGLRWRWTLTQHANTQTGEGDSR